jgi:hypothetical protein
MYFPGPVIGYKYFQKTIFYYPGAQKSQLIKVSVLTVRYRECFTFATPLIWTGKRSF